MALPEFDGFNHPFTGRPTVMTEEDRTQQILHIREFIRELDPRGYLEIQLTRTVAIDNWRLNRLKAVEENLFTAEAFTLGPRIDTEHPQVHLALTHARAFATQAKALNTLSLCEQRLTRVIHQNLNLLLKLQAQRKRQQRQPHALGENEIEPKPLARTATAESPETPPIEFPSAA